MAEDRFDEKKEEEGVEIPVEFDDAPESEEPAAGEEKEAEEAPSESEEAGEAPEEAGGEEEESEAPQEADASQEAPGEGKKGFFGRLKKDKEKEKLEQQVADLTDRLKRSMAEFDNYRKRTEKEKASMYIVGARDIVEKILPVVDSFERGLASAPEGDAFAEGMQMIYRQLLTAMEEMGVKPIEAVGQSFDPNFHNAVMHVEDENAGENVVVEEFQKGYTYKDFVVRHSMVKVAN